MRDEDRKVENADFLSLEGLISLERLHATSLARLRFSTIQKLVSTFAEYIGLSVGFFVPKMLEQYPREIWDIVPYVEKMRELGILKEFQLIKNKYPDEPQGFTTHVALESKTKRIGYGGDGRDLFDVRKTVWPALGEALERWALNIYEPSSLESKYSSYRELSESKMDIFKIAGFSDELRQSRHPTYKLFFTDETKFSWVKGYSLTDNEETWLPLQFVSFKYANTLKERKEPLLSPTISTGAATGQNLRSAATAGLLEVIERDAFMIYWLNKLSPKLVDIRSIPDARIQQMLDIADRYQLEVHLQYLETDVPVHTLGIMIVDRTGFEPAAIISAGSSFDLTELAYKLISASLTMRQSQRRFCEEKKDVGFIDPAVLNHEQRIIYYSRAANFSKLEFLIQGKVTRYEDLLDKRTIAKNLSELLRFFKEKKYQVIYKEILDKRISRELGGVTSVVVRVPEMQPLHLDETLPALSGSRIKEVPTILDLTPASEINRDPHPFP